MENADRVARHRRRQLEDCAAAETGIATPIAAGLCRLEIEALEEFADPTNGAASQVKETLSSMKADLKSAADRIRGQMNGLGRQLYETIAVFCAPLGWVELDPTNNVRVGTDHVAIAWGRDFGDVSPLRGIILGGGTHQLAVSVAVEPLTRS